MPRSSSAWAGLFVFQDSLESGREECRDPSRRKERLLRMTRVWFFYFRTEWKPESRSSEEPALSGVDGQDQAPKGRNCHYLIGATGGGVNNAFTESGTLSAFAISRLTCHI
jgi:hypothetical protein